MTVTSMDDLLTQPAIRRPIARPTSRPIPRARASSALAGDILSRLQIWSYAVWTQMTASRMAGTPAAPKPRKTRRAPRLGIADDHLLRDIGFTRLGIREATLANLNEAG
jgi:hypothetical protein